MYTYILTLQWKLLTGKIGNTLTSLSDSYNKQTIHKLTINKYIHPQYSTANSRNFSQNL